METKILQTKTKSSSMGKMPRIMLICGILSSILYIIMNVIGAVLYRGYSSFSQTVSELSAIDSPTRSLWVPLGIVYTLLVALFGWGVWRSAINNRSLRITGALLVVHGVIGLGWPPMHQREVLAAGGGTFTDTMHIVFSMVTVLLMLIAMWFGAKAFGKQFRYYSFISIMILLVLGTWTGMQGSKLEQNLPTPWLGVIERILILVFLMWIVALAVILLRLKQGKPIAGSIATKLSANEKNKAMSELYHNY